MFRRQLIALGLALAMLLPLSAAADDRESAAAGLVDQMVADLEAFLATDTGDVEARSAEIDRMLTSYFDMDSITRFSACWSSWSPWRFRRRWSIWWSHSTVTSRPTALPRTCNSVRAPSRTALPISPSPMTPSPLPAAGFTTRQTPA